MTPDPARLAESCARLIAARDGLTKAEGHAMTARPIPKGDSGDGKEMAKANRLA